MGIRMFGGSSCHVYDKGCGSSTSSEPLKIIIKGQPNVENFKIVNIFSPCNIVHAVEVVYPDATNYEGRKILLYKGVWLKDITNATVLDPHFINDKSVLSPFARFRPDVEGWAMAKSIAIALSK